MFRLGDLEPVEPLELRVGDGVRLDDGPSIWTVAAVSANFAALTRPYDPAVDDPDPDDEDAHLQDVCTGPRYTVIDWNNGVRGPCNLVGRSFGDGTYSPDECAHMLALFEAGELEVSHRVRARIDITDHHGVGA